MNTRLSDYLNNFDSSQTIMELKIEESQIEANDKNGLTPLQFAVQDGRLDIVYWLLNHNANVKPIPKDVAEAHPLIVSSLAACYNGSSFLSNPIVTLGLFFYALKSQSDILLKRVLPNIKTSPELIELSLSYQKPDIALQFIPGTMLRHQSGIQTAAYLAAMNDVEAVDDFCKTEEDWLLTLSQLEQTPQFDAVLKKAPSELQLQFLLSEKKQHHEEKLSKTQQFFYECAAKNTPDTKKLLMSHCKKTSDYASIYIHAFTLRNLVAVKSILECCNQPEVLLKQLLQKGCHDGAIFMIVANGMDLYFLALKFRYDKQTLNRFIKVCWSQEGLLFGLIRRSILENTNASADILELIRYLSVDKSQFDFLFENAINQQYHLNFSASFSFQLSTPHYQLVQRLGNRIGVVMPSLDDNTFDFLPNELLRLVLTYLGEHQTAELKQLSSRISRLHEASNISNNFHQERMKDILIKQTQLLNDYILFAERDLGLKGKYSNLGQLGTKSEKLLLLVHSLALLGLGITIGVGFLKRNALKELLMGESYTDWMGQLSPCYRNDDIFDGHACAYACVRCPEYIQWGTNIFGMSLAGGLLLITYFFHLTLPCSAIQNQNLNRFNDLPVSDFSKQTRLMAENLFTEFKQTQNNPFSALNLESKVGDVLQTARDTRNMIQTKLTSLSTSKEMIEEDKEEEVNEESVVNISRSHYGRFFSENDMSTPLLRHSPESKGLSLN